jgi:hypothetical protein
VSPDNADLALAAGFSNDAVFVTYAGNPVHVAFIANGIRHTPANRVTVQYHRDVKEG